MLLAAIKRNHLLYLSFIIYLLTLALLLSELDRQYYQTEKKNLIIDNAGKIFAADKSTLKNISTRIVKEYEKDKIILENDKNFWVDHSNKIMLTDYPIFRVELLDKNNEVLLSVEDNKKLDKYNTFKVSLFYKNFTGIISNPLVDFGPNIAGKLKLYYTTPAKFTQMKALTKKYMLWAFLIFCILTTCYSYMLIYLILPMKRVINQIQATEFISPKVIKKPASILEKAYNRLARDAIIIRIGQSVKNLISSDPDLNIDEVFQQILKLTTELLDYKTAIEVEVAENNKGKIKLINFIDVKSPDDNFDYKEYLINDILTKENFDNIKNNDVYVIKDCLVANITQDKKSNILSLMIIFMEHNNSPENWDIETIKQLTNTINADLRTLEMQKKYILDEKNKANINLAENIGHDLTNIIATSKLDIITINKILNLSQEELTKSPDKQNLLRQSTNELLNNTRFLQELVNIYRSFTYLNRPKFEMVDINKILGDISDLFALSTSKNTKIIKDFAANLPNCKIEPRLIKLAIFNILTNAIESIKKNEHTNNESFIKIKTSYSSDKKEICIIIHDSGIGIRNVHGKLASDSEIEKIFHYGHSTKEQNVGQGLGLSWVWTIIKEFHQGEIKPRNHQDGGAEFTINLKCDNS